MLAEPLAGGVRIVERKDLPQTAGLSHYAQLLFDRTDLVPVWTSLIARVDADPSDAGAWLDVALIQLLTGQKDLGLATQARALALSRLYRRVHGDGSGLRVLAIVAPGDFMANTPLEFLFEGSNVRLDLLYVTADIRLPSAIPDHDVAIVAIGESEANLPLLNAVGPMIAGWPRPVVNGRPERIAALTRDGVCAMFADSDVIVAPVTRRLDDQLVAAIATDPATLGDHLPGAVFPIIIRPVDSHAGESLEKIDNAEALRAYLEGQSRSEFYLSAFVDYSQSDGLFRKQRIAVIDGRTFISHLAVSEHWMVHYLSAGMAERPERRMEEAAFMADFDDAFALRHADAFAEMQAAFGLDYFAIDCGETHDGRLLLFEADVAMIVHAMDGGDLFPYKKPVMRRLFSAFLAMLTQVSARGVAPS